MRPVPRHFEKRKPSIGICARAFGTRASTSTSLHQVLAPAARPTQRAGSRSSAPFCTTASPKAEREGWLGEADGLKVSLAGADDKLTQIDAALRRQATTPSSACPHSPTSFQTAPPRPADQQTGQEGTNNSVQRTSHDYKVNQAWLYTAMIACILLAWLKLIALDGDLAKAEPKTLHYRLMHAAARVV